MYKETLSKDLGKLVKIESAASETARSFLKYGIAIVFLAIVWFVANSVTAGIDNPTYIIIAGVIGGYMALNIGANDVANNVGPAVGAKSLTMVGAILIAIVCEASGALIAGGDVVSTIAKGIIDPGKLPDPSLFIPAMMSALLAAALWINIATWVGAPVSTTHSIVGGVMGAGIAVAGFSVVNWPAMAKIAASWVISPVMGGIIAAAFLAFIKARIIYRDDKLAGARRWVPVLVAIMAGVFSAYLCMKGLKQIWKPTPLIVAAIGTAMFFITYAIMRPLVARQSAGMENRNKSIRELFHIPLIFAAALLSFAHGANDVANAVGPLAAIVDSASTGVVSANKVDIPTWVLFVGAVGISVGLALFGPKLIKTVGAQITRLNPMRAYCVALSAAITVIIATTMGLPVSSTHIAVGAIFGVGLYREWKTARQTHINHGKFTAPEANADVPQGLVRRDKAMYRKLVRRQHLMTIVAAWVITVPLSALLAGAILFLMRTFIL
ncbi:MAG: inorganic phosphate transporter [Rhodospirillales bacterium]|nr:inorganic phosphate transporter [Rhodospirillales bacterium]